MRTATRIRQLSIALEDLGFGEDEPISGADTVAVLASYGDLIAKLPAIADMLDRVEQLVNSKGRYHTEMNYNALRATYSQVLL